MNKLRALVLAKFFKGELNPFDGAALEIALQSGYREVSVLAMAPPNAMPDLEVLTRLGVKAVLVTDPKFGGSDTLATTEVLSKAVEKLSPDVILCGRQSVDGDTAQVPPMLAQRLGFAIKAKVMDIQNGAYVLRSGEVCPPRAGTVYTCERCKTLRFPSIFSRKGEVETWSNQDLGADESKVGLSGSATRVIRSYESNVGRRACRFVKAEELTTCIQKGLTFSRAEQGVNDGERLETVHFVGNVAHLARSVGKTAIPLEIAGTSATEAAGIIEQSGAKVVLWEDTEENKLLAPAVAVLLGAGICADCIAFSVRDGSLVMTRPAQGGNVTADVVCTSKVAFATVRTPNKRGSEIVVSVGRGGMAHLEQAREFARSLSADLACSRVVVDSGALPYGCQVGLTGKTVSPKVYVALGISGAVQHTCAISSSGCVIAVNPDKNAGIFDYADYGIVDTIENIFKIYGGKLC